MHTTPIPSAENLSTADNPAISNKHHRLRLRGLSYLRAHSSASASASAPASVSTSNVSSAPDTSNSTSIQGFPTPPASSPPAPSLFPPSPANNTPRSPSSQLSHEPSQHAYFDGRIGPSLQPPSFPADPAEGTQAMARDRAGSAPNGANAVRTMSENGPSNLTGHPHDQMPTIKLIPHQDIRSTRPSLAFPITSRTLPHEDCIIRVGRYSERDTNPNIPPNTPSSAPVGFKSKVVSRRHCEFWCSNGQWYIKDVKSSSGTFLNHIRLSQPSVESRPFPVHDGDVVQLGIDFRGGEEMIFRCVKIRVEVNRAWQKTLNNYNVTTHKRLRDLGKPLKKDSDTASSHSSECSICLMSIAPCQSLFVAPCSHVWHFKCIRPILNDPKSWPQFLCPNCRARHDLEADVDDLDSEAWEDANGADTSPEIVPSQHADGVIPEDEDEDMDGGNEAFRQTTPRRILSVQNADLPPLTSTSSDPVNGTNASTNGSSLSANLLSRRGARRISPPFPPITETRSLSGSAHLRPITPTQIFSGDSLDEASLRTPTTDMLIHDGPMTPTNNAGPFVFDGSAGRAGSRSAGGGARGSAHNVSSGA